jgi:hypothetical protein
MAEMRRIECSFEGLARFIGIVVLLFVWIESCGAKDIQRPDSDRPTSPLAVVCLPERPVAHPGESVVVRAWVVDVSGKALTRPPRWTWSASIGTVDGADVAIWALGNPVLGSTGALRATAKVVVQDQALGQGECELQLLVSKPSVVDKPGVDRSARLSGRALLLPTNSEPKGYGLYSYLLFDTPPKDNLERERYLKALESYLLVLQPIAELERYRRRSELNIMLIPVKRNIELPDDLSSPRQASQAAEQVLAAYDYARASALLADLGKQMVQSGPFLVSIRPAVSNPGVLFLFFDMSRVTPKLVWDWMRAFCSLAAQERSWSEIELKRLALNIRNVIAVAARTTPEVLGALQQWIQIVKAHKKGQ